MSMREYTKGDEKSDSLIVIRIVICFIECKEKSLDISLKRAILSRLNIKTKNHDPTRCNSVCV